MGEEPKVSDLILLYLGVPNGLIFGDGPRDRNIETAIQIVKFVRGDFGVLLCSDLGDRLAHCSVGVDHVR